MSTPSFKGRVRYYISTLPGSVGPPSPLRFGQKQAERPKTRSPARDWRSNLNRPCSEIRPRPAGRGEFFPAMAGSTEVPFSVGSSMQLRLFRSPVCFFILRAKPPLACAGGEGPCRGAPPAHPSSSLAARLLSCSLSSSSLTLVPHRRAWSARLMSSDAVGMRHRPLCCHGLTQRLGRPRFGDGAEVAQPIAIAV